MYSMYNQTWPNQPLESQPLHSGSLKITCSDHLSHTTAKSILWAWYLLCPVLPSNHDSLQNSVCLLCHADLSAPVYLSPKVSFSDLLSLIPPFFCPPVPSLFSATLPFILHQIHYTHTYSSYFPLYLSFSFHILLPSLVPVCLFWWLIFYWGNQDCCITAQDKWTGHVLLVSDTVIK